jgi:YbgC/YbaW family acyl-CoA thioester hydrolase
MNRADFRFFDRQRVRRSEIDAQRIVFNAHYLTFLDTAMAGYYRALAFPYPDAMHALGGDTYVRKATVEYEASAVAGDLIDTAIRCERVGNSSMNFRWAVFRGDQVLVQGELVYVYADPASQTARNVPAPLRETLRAYEAGEAMVGTTAVLGAALESTPRAALAALRRKVFVEELGQSEALVEDADDGAAWQLLAHNRAGALVGSGRLLLPAAGPARIGRLAVHPALRSAGIGAQLVESLLGKARELGCDELELAAHADATALYARAGFAEVQRDSGVVLMRRRTA